VARRLYGDHATEYLREVEALADDFRLTDFTDRTGYTETVRTACREFDADHLWHVRRRGQHDARVRGGGRAGLEVNSPESVALLNDKLAMRTLLRRRRHLGDGVRRSPSGGRTWAALLDGFRLPVS